MIKQSLGTGLVQLRDYLHIPHVVRTSRFSKRSKLPTTDYLSLRRKSTAMSSTQSDLRALVLLKDPDLNVLSSMPDLVKHAKENFEVGHHIWEKLGVESMDDAWTLPIHARLAAHYDSQNEGMAMDDTTRSATICWNGCPECVNQLQNTLGGMLGMISLTNTSWMSGLIKEWQVLTIINILISVKWPAETQTCILVASTVSTWLPRMGSPSVQFVYPGQWAFTCNGNRLWTQLIVRSTDLSGLRIGDDSGPALGIEGHGLNACSGSIAHDFTSWCSWSTAKGKKIIQLLYYDAETCNSRI